MSTLAFSLAPVPPFRLDLTVWALRRRPGNVVDRWDGRTYRRALLVGGRPVEVAVEQPDPPEAPTLAVTLEGDGVAPHSQPAVEAALDRLLSTRVDLAEFYRLAERDPHLGPLAARFRGLKPPRYPTLFEALANAIACQQVTLTLGLTLLNRLSLEYGPAAHAVGITSHAFPRPEDLATLDPEALRRLGFSYAKARALLELSSALAQGRLDLEELAKLDDEAAVARLRLLRGVGRWTAEYLLLRGLGRLNVFPGDDSGARGNLRRWLGLPEPTDYEGVRRVVASWQPCAGFVYFHLLLRRLEEAGQL